MSVNGHVAVGEETFRDAADKESNGVEVESEEARVEEVQECEEDDGCDGDIDWRNGDKSVKGEPNNLQVMGQGASLPCSCLKIHDSPAATWSAKYSQFLFPSSYKVDQIIIKPLEMEAAREPKKEYGRFSTLDHTLESWQVAGSPSPVTQQINSSLQSFQDLTREEKFREESAVPADTEEESRTEEHNYNTSSDNNTFKENVASGLFHHSGLMDEKGFIDKLSVCPGNAPDSILSEQPDDVTDKSTQQLTDATRRYVDISRQAGDMELRGSLLPPDKPLFRVEADHHEPSLSEKELEIYRDYSEDQPQPFLALEKETESCCPNLPVDCDGGKEEEATPTGLEEGKGRLGKEDIPLEKECGENSLFLEEVETNLSQEQREKDYKDILQEQEQRGKDYKDILQEQEQRGKDYKDILQEQEQRGKDYKDVLEEQEQRGKDYKDVLEEQDQRGKDYRDILQEQEQRNKDYKDILQEQEQRGKAFKDILQEQEQRGKDYKDVLEEQDQRGKDYRDILQEQEQRNKDYKDILQEQEQRGKAFKDILQEQEQRGEDYKGILQEQEQRGKDILQEQREKDYKDIQQEKRGEDYTDILQEQRGKYLPQEQEQRGKYLSQEQEQRGKYLPQEQEQRGKCLMPQEQEKRGNYIESKQGDGHKNKSVSPKPVEGEEGEEGQRNESDILPRHKLDLSVQKPKCTDTENVQNLGSRGAGEESCKSEHEGSIMMNGPPRGSEVRDGCAVPATPTPCCFPPSVLPPACLYNQAGKVCTLFSNRFILAEVNASPLLVSTRVENTVAGPFGVALLWRGGKPVVLEEVPEGANVCFDAVLLPGTAKFVALVVWQAGKPIISIEPYFNSFVVVDEFYNIKVKLVSYSKDYGVVRAVIHGKKQSIVFSKSVFYISGLKVSDKKSIEMFVDPAYGQLYANVCMFVRATYSFVCTCLWSGKEPQQGTSATSVDYFTLYKRATGCYVKGREQFCMYLDAQTKLVVDENDCSLEYERDTTKVLIPFPRERTYFGNKQVAAANVGHVKAHVRWVVDKEGKETWSAVMVQLPECLVATPEAATADYTCCFKKSVLSPAKISHGELMSGTTSASQPSPKTPSSTVISSIKLISDKKIVGNLNSVMENISIHGMEETSEDKMKEQDTNMSLTLTTEIASSNLNPLSKVKNKFDSLKSCAQSGTVNSQKLLGNHSRSAEELEATKVELSGTISRENVLQSEFNCESRLKDASSTGGIDSKEDYMRDTNAMDKSPPSIPSLSPSSPFLPPLYAPFFLPHPSLPSSSLWPSPPLPSSPSLPLFLPAPAPPSPVQKQIPKLFKNCHGTLYWDGLLRVFRITTEINGISSDLIVGKKAVYVDSVRVKAEKCNKCIPVQFDMHFINRPNYVFAVMWKGKKPHIVCNATKSIMYYYEIPGIYLGMNNKSLCEFDIELDGQIKTVRTKYTTRVYNQEGQHCTSIPLFSRVSLHLKCRIFRKPLVAILVVVEAEQSGVRSEKSTDVFLSSVFEDQARRGADSPNPDLLTMDIPSSLVFILDSSLGQNEESFVLQYCHGTLYWDNDHRTFLISAKLCGVSFDVRVGERALVVDKDGITEIRKIEAPVPVVFDVNVENRTKCQIVGIWKQSKSYKPNSKYKIRRSYYGLLGIYRGRSNDLWEFDITLDGQTSTIRTKCGTGVYTERGEHCTSIPLFSPVSLQLMEMYGTDGTLSWFAPFVLAGVGQSDSNSEQRTLAAISPSVSVSEDLDSTQKLQSKMLKNCKGLLNWQSDLCSFKISTLSDGAPSVIHVGETAWMCENSVAYEVNRCIVDLPVYFDVCWDENATDDNYLLALWVGEKPEVVNRNKLRYYFDVSGSFEGYEKELMIIEGNERELMKFDICISGMRIAIKTDISERIFSPEGQPLNTIPLYSQVVLHLIQKTNLEFDAPWTLPLAIVKPALTSGEDKKEPLPSYTTDSEKKSQLIHEDLVEMPDAVAATLPKDRRRLCQMQKWTPKQEEMDEETTTQIIQQEVEEVTLSNEMKVERLNQSVKPLSSVECEVSQLLLAYKELQGQALNCRRGLTFHIVSKFFTSECSTTHYPQYGHIKQCSDEFAIIESTSGKSTAICCLSSIYDKDMSLNSGDVFQYHHKVIFSVLLLPLKQALPVCDGVIVDALAVLAWCEDSLKLVTVHECGLHQSVVTEYKQTLSTTTNNRANTEFSPVYTPFQDATFDVLDLESDREGNQNTGVAGNDPVLVPCQAGSNVFSFHEEVMLACGLRRMSVLVKYFANDLVVCISKQELIWCKLFDIYISGKQCISMEELLNNMNGLQLVVTRTPAVVLGGKTVSLKAVIGFTDSEVLLPGIHVCSEHRGILLFDVGDESAIARGIFSEVQAVWEQSDVCCDYLQGTLHSWRTALSSGITRTRDHTECRGLVASGDDDIGMVGIALGYQDPVRSVSAHRSLLLGLPAKTSVKSVIGQPVTVVVGRVKSGEGDGLWRVVMGWGNFGLVSSVASDTVGTSDYHENICCPKALVIQHFNDVYRRTKFRILKGSRQTEADNVDVFVCTDGNETEVVRCQRKCVLDQGSEDSLWSVLVQMSLTPSQQAIIRQGIGAWRSTTLSLAVQICQDHGIQFVGGLLAKEKKKRKRMLANSESYLYEALSSTTVLNDSGVSQGIAWLESDNNEEGYNDWNELYDNDGDLVSVKNNQGNLTVWSRMSSKETLYSKSNSECVEGSGGVLETTHESMSGGGRGERVAKVNITNTGKFDKEDQVHPFGVTKPVLRVTDEAPRSITSCFLKTWYDTYGILRSESDYIMFNKKHIFAMERHEVKKLSGKPLNAVIMDFHQSEYIFGHNVTSIGLLVWSHNIPMGWGEELIKSSLDVYREDWNLELFESQRTLEMDIECETPVTSQERKVLPQQPGPTESPTTSPATPHSYVTLSSNRKHIETNCARIVHLSTKTGILGVIHEDIGEPGEVNIFFTNEIVYINKKTLCNTRTMKSQLSSLPSEPFSCVARVFSKLKEGKPKVMFGRQIQYMAMMVWYGVKPSKQERKAQRADESGAMASPGPHSTQPEKSALTDSLITTCQAAINMPDTPAVSKTGVESQSVIHPSTGAKEKVKRSKPRRRSAKKGAVAVNNLCMKEYKKLHWNEVMKERKAQRADESGAMATPGPRSTQPEKSAPTDSLITTCQNTLRKIGHLVEVYSEMGRLKLKDGQLLYFPRDKCFLYGLCLSKVELCHVLSVGDTVEVEQAWYELGRSIQSVWVMGPDTLDPAQLHSNLYRWCCDRSVPEATKTMLLMEARWLPPDLDPLADYSQDKEVITLL